MNPFNAIHAVVDALKVPREPMLPEALIDATPLQLAEARSRLSEISKVANSLRKLVDEELAGALEEIAHYSGVGALNYGGQIIRSSNGKGSAKVIDPDGFWNAINLAVRRSESPALLASLFPASSVRLTALPQVAKLIDVSPEAFKDTFIAYDPPTSPLSVMPKDKAPKYLQDLEEGQIR